MEFGPLQWWFWWHAPGDYCHGGDVHLHGVFPGRIILLHPNSRWRLQFCQARAWPLRRLYDRHRDINGICDCSSRYCGLYWWLLPIFIRLGWSAYLCCVLFGFYWPPSAGCWRSAKSHVGYYRDCGACTHCFCCGDDSALQCRQLVYHPCQ